MTTPALYDGTYYFKVAATYNGSSEGTSAAVGKYMARGTAYGTHLSLDSYGLPVRITTNSSNQTTMKMADTNGYVFSTGSYDAYADGGSATTFTMSIVNGKYLIASDNREGKYLKYNNANVADEEISVFDDGTGTNNGPIILWAVESISDHATAMQAKKDNQAAAAAAAAFASGNYTSLTGITTVSALETELTANYVDGAFVNPTEISTVEESYQPRNNTNGNLVPVTVYSNTINITEAGFYKFSMQAFNRATWNDNVQALHTEGADMPAAVLFFGDSETQIKSLYDEIGHDAAVEGADPADTEYNGKYSANCKKSALKMFKDDKYHNDVWFYCSTPGEYTYGVKVMGYAPGQWFIYSPQSVTITSYAAAADDADYAALNAAISTYEAASWGFEAGEYAPYNNVEAINSYETAKAIDQTKDNSKLLINSMTTALQLTGPNAAEVNAVYDGTFAAATNNGAPVGWTMSNNALGGEAHSRAFVGDDRLSEFNNSKSGFFLRFDGTNSNRGSQYYYGQAAGYTMPLKADTYYRVKVDFTNWGTTEEKPLRLNVDGPNFNQYQELTSVKDADGGENNPDQFNFTFKTGSAGNYELRFQVPGNDANAHNVMISNIELFKATFITIDEEVTYANTQSGVENVILKRTIREGANTLVLPFDMTQEEVKANFGDDAKVYVISGFNASTISFTEQEGIIANAPCVLEATKEGSSFLLTDRTLVASETAVTTVGNLSMIGTYAPMEEITQSDNNYILYNDNLYYVNSVVGMDGTRAYFKVEGVNETRVLSVVYEGDEATEIAEIDEEPVEDGVIYNLAGQVVGADYKGIAIINGKKVLLK